MWWEIIQMVLCLAYFGWQRAEISSWMQDLSSWARAVAAEARLESMDEWEMRVETALTRLSDMKARQAKHNEEVVRNMEKVLTEFNVRLTEVEKRA